MRGERTAEERRWWTSTRRSTCICTRTEWIRRSPRCRGRCLREIWLAILPHRFRSLRKVASPSVTWISKFKWAFSVWWHTTGSWISTPGCTSWVRTPMSQLRAFCNPWNGNALSILPIVLFLMCTLIGVNQPTILCLLCLLDKWNICPCTLIGVNQPTLLCLLCLKDKCNSFLAMK